MVGGDCWCARAWEVCLCYVLKHMEEHIQHNLLIIEWTKQRGVLDSTLCALCRAYDAMSLHESKGIAVANGPHNIQATIF